MNNLNYSNGEIRPFNLDTNEFEKMFNEPAGSDVRMAAYWYSGVEDWNSELGMTTANLMTTYRAVMKAYAAFEPTSIQPTILHCMGHFEDLPLAYEFFAALRDPSQHWYLYPQAAFFKEGNLGSVGDRSQKLHNGLQTAINLLDELWEISGSIEPKQLPILDLESDLAKKYRGQVGKLYADRIGVLHRGLVEPYNRFMVMIHAIVKGCEPIAAIRKRRRNPHSGLPYPQRAQLIGHANWRNFYQ